MFETIKSLLAAHNMVPGKGEDGLQCRQEYMLVLKDNNDYGFNHLKLD